MSSIEMEILSDEEFYKMKEQEKKDKFFESLVSATKTSTKRMGFSVKSIKKRETKETSPPKDTTKKTEGSIQEDSSFKRSRYKTGEFDEKKWGNLLDKFDDLQSPIEAVTEDEIGKFGENFLRSMEDTIQKEQDPYTRYEKLFKKEITMYADILNDVHKQAKLLKNRLSAMDSSRKSQGVTKYFSDLLEQYNSLSNTQITAIKNMADLKAKAEDFRLKQMKAEGENGGERGVDEIVDQFYGKVMGGNRAQYMSQSLMSQSPYDSDREKFDQISSGQYESPEGETLPRAAWNITQPIPQEMGDPSYTSISSKSADAYGYIRNEYRKPEICIQRFDDEKLSFVALDEDGLEVENYELPGDDLLETIAIKPMSNFAYDKYGRKYSIIDINTDGVDLSDLDDPNYQFYEE